MPRGEWIKPGERYGKILVKSVCDRKPGAQKKYSCKCLICGNTFVDNGQGILRRQNSGCAECRKAVERRRWEAEILTHVGETYGDLEIIGFGGFETVHRKKGGDYSAPVMVCTCKNCGEESRISLKRLKDGGARQCKKCNLKNLDIGRDYARAESVEGTKISAIDGRKKVNKNSSTGHTGVSFQKSNGKYRAYINFKRKQYHLGEYSNIKSAVAAREAAEMEIYGNFLDWYATGFPENWEKLRRKDKSKDYGKNIGEQKAH